MCFLQISIADHWCLALVLVDDNVDVPGDEDKEETEEEKGERLADEIKKRELKLLAGRTPATSGPIGRLEPAPSSGKEVKGAAAGLSQKAGGGSAPEILQNLRQKLEQSGSWGR